MISYNNNNDIKPIHKDIKGDTRYQNIFDSNSANNHNSNNWNMWNNGHNEWPIKDNINPFGFPPNDNTNNNREKDNKIKDDGHRKDKNIDESRTKESSDSIENQNENEKNDENNKENKDEKTNINYNPTDNINDSNEDININKNLIQMNNSVDNKNKNSENFIGIGGNITITIPIFSLIIIIVLGLIAVAIFIFFKIKKNKRKKEEDEDDDNKKEKKIKQKNTIGSPNRNYENPYPIHDLFKDPTEACQDYINTLGRLRYKDPIVMYDPDHPSQRFNFFPSPSLASSTFSTTNPSSSHIYVPQSTVVDPQLEKSTILPSKISHINQSFSTSITELDSSNKQIHSFNESNPLIDSISIIQSSASQTQSIIIPINNTSISNIDTKSESK